MSTTTVISLVDPKTSTIVRTVRKSGRSEAALLRIMAALVEENPGLSAFAVIGSRIRVVEVKP